MTVNPVTYCLKSDIIIYVDIGFYSVCNALTGDETNILRKIWLMAFNPEKCEVIRITKKKKTVLFDYKLHGITLQLTKNAKYLGIQISDDLAWSKHINQMTTKSNNTLKFIKRNIQTNIHKIKETAYKTYVRPLLEYSATVLDPWQKKYINQIEMVQHRAVRYIFNDYNFTSSVSSMLNQLALPTLEKRRKIASLSMFYKINHGLVRIKFPDYIKPTLRNRFSIPYSRIDAHIHSSQEPQDYGTTYPRLDQLSSPGNIPSWN